MFRHNDHPSSDPIFAALGNEIVMWIDDDKCRVRFVKLQIRHVFSSPQCNYFVGFCAAFLSGTTNVTELRSRMRWFASANSMSTLCGPGRRPIRMIGLPLASAQTHEESSTVT